MKNADGQRQADMEAAIKDLKARVSALERAITGVVVLLRDLDRRVDEKK